ncbi:hypothetical protein [Nevskia sp.]|uniref:hypothetical protein n=1 Tax=Nevskia sp. TaxID=1929292 RepID=UPI002600E2ED|nr:hypothetical protein [Nevskia sp.]
MTLILNTRRRWIDLPGSQGTRLQLSPLPASRRAALIEQAMVTRPPANGARKSPPPVFDQAVYGQLVAAECLHGWDGVDEQGDDGRPHPVPFSADGRTALMEIDPVAAFVINTVTGLGIHLQQLETDAGNDSARALPG